MAMHMDQFKCALRAVCFAEVFVLRLQMCREPCAIVRLSAASVHRASNLCLGFVLLLLIMQSERVLPHRLDRRHVTSQPPQHSPDARVTWPSPHPAPVMWPAVYHHRTSTARCCCLRSTERPSVTALLENVRRVLQRRGCCHPQCPSLRLSLCMNIMGFLLRILKKMHKCWSSIFDCLALD